MSVARLVRGWVVAVLAGVLAVVLVVPVGSVGSVASAAAADTAPARAASTAKEGFRDVTGSHKFYREIAWLSGAGVTHGYADNTFKPRNYVSREAFAAFLYRLAGRPAVSVPAQSPFSDVKTDAQFYSEIVWLSQQGIAHGWADGTFRPKWNITRDAMAAFLYRYEGRPDFTPPAASVFRDVPSDSPFYREITWLRHTGVSTGWADKTFRPYAATSREATAAFLFRAFAPSGYVAPAYKAPDPWAPSAWLTQQLNDPASPLVVVNKRRPLSPSNYAPSDLVTVSGVPGGSQHRLRREAARQLAAMHKDAKAAGATFAVTSSYRSRSHQSQLFSSYVSRRGKAAAETFSARPGYSEHQTGWAVDIYTNGHRLTSSFGNTTAGRWAATHGHKYGFVVRYPQGKTHITGFKYEPWHLRYVGVELATHMKSHGIQTLEEQFGLLAAPNYP